MAPYPVAENLQFYGLIGAGYNLISYELHGTLFSIPVTFQQDRDTDISLQYGLRLIYKFGEQRIGIHARRFELDSSSELFGFNNIEVGDDFVGLSLGWGF